MDTDEKRKFSDYLQGRELRFTPERQLILEEVFKTHRHFEAEDIVMGLRGRGQRVSRASIYRTLPLLVESGLLREVPSAEKHSHYEHIFGHDHHDHLICTQCGGAFEFCEPLIENLQDSICRAYGFRPAHHKLEITGVCSECARELPD